MAKVRKNEAKMSKSLYVPTPEMQNIIGEAFGAMVKTQFAMGRHVTESLRQDNTIVEPNRSNIILSIVVQTLMRSIVFGVECATNSTLSTGDTRKLLTSLLNDALLEAEANSETPPVIQ